MSETLAYGYDQSASALEASNQVLQGIRLAPTSVEALLIAEQELKADEEVVQKARSPAIGELATTQHVEVQAAPAEVPTSSHTIPGTTLERERVKALLAKSQNGAADEHIADLLILAWQGSSIVERPVPSELIPYFPHDLNAWYKTQAAYVKQLIAERTGLVDIYDQTDVYEIASPFLRNINVIQDMAIIRRARFDGLCVQVAARLLLLEAIRARNSA
jgi:hypothetical protein